MGRPCENNTMEKRNTDLLRTYVFVRELGTCDYFTTGVPLAIKKLGIFLTPNNRTRTVSKGMRRMWTLDAIGVVNLDTNRFQ